MAKMTKAQARKRLNESITKVRKVWIHGRAHLTTAQQTKIRKAAEELDSVANKLK